MAGSLIHATAADRALLEAAPAARAPAGQVSRTAAGRSVTFDRYTIAPPADR